MECFFKAGLTAATVLLVMLAARRGGTRLAGVIAALPTMTAPTLAWLAHEEGMRFAVSAAIGSVAACGMLAVFALGYALAARRGGRFLALACGVGAALAMSLPAEATSSDLRCALLLALCTCATAFAVMPQRGNEVAPRPHSSRTTLLVAVATGVFTALAASVGPSLGGFATGLLASLPLITGPVAMVEHASSGHAAAAHFLRAYVGGLFGKAAFGAVFVLLAPHTNAMPALLVACACAGLLSTVRIWRRPTFAVGRGLQ